MQIFKLLKFFIFIMLLLITTTCHAEENKILPSEFGIVENIEYVDVLNDAVQVKQVVDVKILSGKQSGDVVQLDNIMTGNPYYDINLKKGVKVILHVEDSNGNLEYSIEDIKRSSAIIWLSLIFAGLLIYVGKKKGLLSLFSIGFTVLFICNFLSPLVLLGMNAVLATALICALSTALTMYLVGGFNSKSTSAVIGTLLSLSVASILSYFVILTANLTGFSNETSLFLYTAHPELNFADITIATMMLATLGAVMDVGMSIASTVNEIGITDPSKNFKELFNSGMNVGKDIIGTMANTLILVYLGGSLPLLLLANNIDMQKFINLNQVVTEISSALIGSIAIVICVPLTAFITASLVSKKNNNIDINSIE